jgi:hypothetical protein
MKITIEQYIKEAKTRLTCNKEVKKGDTGYIYSNQQIDDNIPYFQEALKDGLSPYKALLYFNDYLKTKKNVKLEL